MKSLCFAIWKEIVGMKAFLSHHFVILGGTNPDLAWQVDSLIDRLHGYNCCKFGKISYDSYGRLAARWNCDEKMFSWSQSMDHVTEYKSISVGILVNH